MYVYQKDFLSDRQLERRRRRHLNAAVGPVMPESCQDLRQIGHSLNGFYTIKSTNELRSVFCDFDNSSGNKAMINLN
jgi:hypothetical protein